MKDDVTFRVTLSSQSNAGLDLRQDCDTMFTDCDVSGLRSTKLPCPFDQNHSPGYQAQDWLCCLIRSASHHAAVDRLPAGR